MKTITILLAFVFVIPRVAAQDPNYSGPAKNQVKMFWAQIEKLKAGTASSSAMISAERAIK
ncbi:MAG: hypothetical protein ACKVOM_04565, partial [Ferruginibacter sp.]